jgi:hypothetical protein
MNDAKRYLHEFGKIWLEATFRWSRNSRAMSGNGSLNLAMNILSKRVISPPEILNVDGSWKCRRTELPMS